MNLKTVIEQIFIDNSNYTNPVQAVNQASSLNALSGDLYTEAKRFIYELLQNADDASLNNGPVEVWIKTFEDYLVVAHTGKPFNPRDLRGLCNVNNGTKKSDPTKTGYKGIGFKSVFGQSDRVLIFTNNEYFRFDSSYQFKWKWELSKIEWEQQNDRKFQFPWQIIPIFTKAEEVPETINQYLQDINANVATIIQLKNLEETRKAVQNLSQNLNMFLFLKNISKISFDISTPVCIEIDRIKADRIILKQNGELKNSWLINTINLTVLDDLKSSLKGERNIPEKLLNAASLELTLAAKIGNDGITKLRNEERLLYSYLPTEERKYSLPVLVNTSFLIGSNRETLHVNSKWNQWIFKNIAIEIFNWIPKLVNSEFQYQAYRLIPNKTSYDELGIEFNKGIDEALESVPFIITNENNFVKVKDAIVDFTFLSSKDFIGETTIKHFINENKIHRIENFAKYTGFGKIFKNLGVTSFEWENIRSFLLSNSFINIFNISKNIELIKYFKKLSDAKKINAISVEKLRHLPFIIDHKNLINYPTRVCFPSADDENWNNPSSELSFLHPKLQDWLLIEPEIRIWLESLGMIEKTDITYITQTILPQIDNYVTLENAQKTIQDLFLLYKKGELKKDLIKHLSTIKLLTQKGTLRSAENCYFSDYYNPRLSIEKTLKQDIFISELYCTTISDKDEWKRFFKMLGVKEGIFILSYSEKHSTIDFVNLDYKTEYFDSKTFKPFKTTFIADNFRDIKSFSHIHFTENNFPFAIKFWQDVLESYSPNRINVPATAFWGKYSMAGRTKGDEIKNYVTWYIKNVKCIPVLSGKCEVSSSIFLNSNEIKSIAGNYLPIFDGVELSPDWRDFFNFKTSLQLADYLELLEKIAGDVNENGNIKNDNFKRVQSIYHEFLDSCINWSKSEISQVQEWAKTGRLLNTERQFTECKTLKCFLEGNDSIFQEQFLFLKISTENIRHANLEVLLVHFGITILRQSDFKLAYIEKEICFNLITHLKAIIPYFKIWIEHETDNDENNKSLEHLEDKVEKLNIYQAEELKITYSGIDFTKSVNVHFNKTNLFVTNTWNANSVLLKLPEVLCRYFYLIGHDKKLDFLLRSNHKEIQNYFEQEEIDIPENIVPNFIDDGGEEIQLENFRSFAEISSAIKKGKISPEFFHLSKPEYDRLKYVEKLISRAVTNITKHLSLHPEYDCQYSYEIAPSIIGGITKNGNEIAIVARPSDNEEVILYYSSEFDVLEYVDAEFWCEDGINLPKQITLGQLFKKTGINRIPIKNINISDSDIDTFLNTPKSEELDFNPVPFVPQKIAQIISSFANTNGGSLIFGLKETSTTTNEIVGLSTDFRVVEITKKAISLLSPIPNVTYDWIKSGEKSIFVIKTEKTDNDVLLDNRKYLRKGGETLEETSTSNFPKILANSQFKKTIAIIIGIEGYLPKNKISPVKYANADTLKFKKMLIEDMNVEEEDIHTFINEEALKNSLEYDLKGLFHYLTENDRLIFYYVGHGFHNGITNYLTTYDTHKYNIAETAVSLRKILLDPLKKSKCKTALIFIDACAQSFQDENERSLITDINDEEFKLLNNEFPYYATFLSCHTGQKSYSSDILENGIWTYYLVEAISGNVPEVIRDNKYVTDILLRNYLSTSVAEYTKEKLSRDQNPKAILDASNESIITEIE